MGILCSRSEGGWAQLKMEVIKAPSVQFNLFRKTYFLLQVLSYIHISNWHFELTLKSKKVVRIDVNFVFLTPLDNFFSALLQFRTFQLQSLSKFAQKKCSNNCSIYGSKEEIDDQLWCFLVLGSATGKGESLGCMHLVGNPFKAHISHQMVNGRVCASPWSRWPWSGSGRPFRCRVNSKVQKGLYRAGNRWH